MKTKNGLLDRRAVVNELLRDRAELMVVAGLGASAWDITAAGDHDLSVPLWGAMGGSVMIGLGIAIAQPDKPVLVITGDGEMLMGMGSLATAAAQAPKNLTIVVLDNERYGETGMQQTHTGLGADLKAIAAGAGIANAGTATEAAEVTALRDGLHRRDGLRFATVKIDPEKLPLVLPPTEGSVIKNRFRVALLGRSALYA